MEIFIKKGLRDVIGKEKHSDRFRRRSIRRIDIVGTSLKGSHSANQANSRVRSNQNDTPNRAHRTDQFHSSWLLS